MQLEWVTIQKAATESGYSVNALRNKIRRNQLFEERHWRRAQDGRILINLENFAAWQKQ